MTREMRMEDPREAKYDGYETWVENLNLEFTDETLGLFERLLEIESLAEGIHEAIQMVKDQAADVRRQREIGALDEILKGKL